MKKFSVIIFLIFNQTIFATSASVDIDSYTFLAGQTNQNTCLYSKPSSSSVCLERINIYSVLSASQTTKDLFTKTSNGKLNPKWGCTYGSDYSMNCTGGEPWIRTDGWIYSKYFKNVRHKESCDGFDEISIYLERPSISCTDTYCNIDVGYSPSPNEIEVSATITTYDKRGKYLGTEEEDESDYFSNGSTDITISIVDEVETVVLTDVSCEKY